MGTSSFELVGPFDMKRSDQLVAANLISFRLGSVRAKAFAYFLVVGATLVIVGSVVIGDWGGVVAAILFLSLVFVVAPLLRSNALSRGIIISDTAEGLQIETPQVKATYKWGRLGPARLIANRLFVNIDGNCALVIPRRATTHDNLLAIAETIVSRA